ncbi:MAG TPA: hypothetical protein VKB89_28410 [Xanthobacteraceae bacterium]|nr:hypothetical protein [Xanthobacteraceae bacterium]
MRDLIRRMSLENPLWGRSATKIHGELLKLGIEVAQSMVSIYMVPRRDCPLQTWKTFICNHMKGIARSGNACRRMHSMRASKKAKGHLRNKPRLHASPPVSIASRSCASAR